MSQLLLRYSSECKRDHKLANKIRRRVLKGVAYIDRMAELPMGMVDPMWRERIVSPLDMTSNTEDILGQIFGHFKDGCRALALDHHSNEPADFGFAVREREINAAREESEALRRAWLIELFSPKMLRIAHLAI